MTDYLMDSLVSYGMDYAKEYIASILQQYIGVIVLICIPALILAVAYCFFGIRIYRILLVIKGVFGGGLVGMVLIGAMTESGVGAVIGFLLFGALFGALSWFFYKVFLFIQAFFVGLITTGGIFIAMTGNMGVSLAIGIIAGLALAVLICIYTKKFVMIMTAYNGAGSIASILSLFFIASKAYNIVNLLLLVGFTVLGFYVQNRFFADAYDAEKGESSTSQKHKPAGCKLVGIEGMYKGFEFDLTDSITFGRDVDSCNVIFPDTCAGVSRIQCQVTYDRKKKSVSIIDSYSSYGTTLNGTKLEINRQTPMNNGDVVMFGENNVFKLNC